MEVHSLGLATDLMLLRLAGSLVEDHGDHLVARTPDNPTFWWGNFLALPTPPSPDQAPGWLERFAELFPDAAHRAIAVDRAPDGFDPTPWQVAGMTYDPGTALVASVLRPPPRPNEDADYRPFGEDGDWEQLVKLRLANNAADPEGHEDAAYETFTRARVDGHRRRVQDGHGRWWGAFVDGRLASTMGLFTDGSGLARFQDVDTDPAFRRRGLAGTLAHQVGSWGLTELGAGRLVIVADPDAEAISVYRSVGFVDAEPVHQLVRPPAP